MKWYRKLGIGIAALTTLFTADKTLAQQTEMYFQMRKQLEDSLK